MSIDSLSVEETEVADGGTIGLSAQWSVADRPDTPLTFSIALPEGLQGYSSSFPMENADGEAMGQCEVTAAKITCTADDNYVKSHPLNISGTVNFRATVERSGVTVPEQKSFTIEGKTVTVTVNPPGTCQSNCADLTRGSYKQGYREGSRYADLRWNVSIPSGSEGMAQGQTVKVTDNLTDNQKFTAIAVIGVTVVNGARNYNVVAEWHEDGSSHAFGIDEFKHDGVTFDVDSAHTSSTVSFTTRAGFAYFVAYRTLPTDGGAQGTYENSAKASVEGTDYNTVSASAQYIFGSADINGEAAPETTAPATPETTAPATPETTAPAVSSSPTPEETCVTTSPATEGAGESQPSEGSTCEVPQPSESEEPESTPSTSLPRTGSDVLGAAAAGALLLLAGASAFALSRRQKSKD